MKRLQIDQAKEMIRPLVDKYAQAFAATGNSEAAQERAGWEASTAADLSDHLSCDNLYDCRDLDMSFVIDTGRERMQQIIETGEAPIPNDPMLLEFGGVCVDVSTGHYLGEMSNEGFRQYIADGRPNDVGAWCMTVSAFPMPLTSFEETELILLDGIAEIWNSFQHARKNQQEDVSDPYEAIILPHPHTDDWDEDAGQWLPNPEGAATSLAITVRTAAAVELALGILTLLDERLLIDAPFYTPAMTSVNVKRKRNGIAPLQPYHALRLNLAEARARTRNVALLKHESPRLHWRRGHSRTIARLSEFERRVWVKRCLVGDPDKGFVAKHYRPIWQPTIH